MSFAAKIGVLVSQGSCPSGHYPTIITLDAEDSHNATEYSGDDKKPIGITGTGQVEFSYCVFDYDELIKVPYDYVVLRMDKSCPKGSLAFARYHDTEDSDNSNSPKGDFSVWPSDIGDNAKLEYCFVPKETDPKKIRYQYPFPKEYGVFASPESSSSIVRNRVKVDDEDTGNKNGWDWHGITDNSIKDRIKKIVEDGKNVVYHTIKWKGDEGALPPMSLLWRATVGVIKVDGKASCQKTFTIGLDAEDHGNLTGVTKGMDDHPGISLGSHMKFDYCVVDGTDIPRARYDYAVLKLSKYCPFGAYPFNRHHNTEDLNNANSPKGSSVIWPSVINDDATLEYCLVPKKSGGKAYPFSASYGVFADNPGIDNVVFTEMRFSDEDQCPYEWVSQNRCGNADEFSHPRCNCHARGVSGNEWNWYGVSSSIVSQINKIMYEKDFDTFFRYIHWNGKSLKKEANMVVVDQAAPAVQSFSPEIKGFDHSAVTVELKSAGNVHVSIVNLKGAVVANISRENLQPGFHSLEWHSGIVPNGRYIVTVKQNGMVAAKNVILK